MKNLVNNVAWTAAFVVAPGIVGLARGRVGKRVDEPHEVGFYKCSSCGTESQIHPNQVFPCMCGGQLHRMYLPSRGQYD